MFTCNLTSDIFLPHLSIALVVDHLRFDSRELSAIWGQLGSRGTDRPTLLHIAVQFGSLILLQLEGLLVSKDSQHDSLQSLYCQLPDSEHLAVRQDVKVGHNDFPDVINSRNIH